MKRIIVCGLLLLGFAGARFAFAQDIELERIVVTPSRIEQEEGDIARNVDIISAQDIEYSLAKDLNEALEDITALNISDYGALGVTKNIRMRGSSAAQVLVLVDGRPINNPRDGTAELSNIALENVDRIEVMHGPGSSIYGAGAMGGAVNIITKKPPKENQKTEITSKFGTYRTYIEGLSHGARLGKFGYLFNYEFKKSDGFRANSEFDAQDASSKLEYELSPNNSLGLSYGFYKSRLGAPGKLTSPDDDDKEHRLKNFLDLAVNLKPDESTGISARAYQDYDRLEFLENTAGSAFDTALKKDIHTTKMRGYDLSLNRKIFDSYGLTFGFNYVTNLNDSTNSAKHEYTVRACYLENRLDIGEDLDINFGGRLDDYSNFGSELNPSMSISYALNPENKLHFLASRSFRAPTFNDLYWPDEGWAKGNPNVKPEEGITVEAGIKSKINRHISCGLTYYRNNYDNLINWAEEAGVWTPSNVNSALIDGVEFNNNLYLTKMLEAEISYTYLRAKDDKLDKYLIYQPKHKAGLSLKYKNPNGLFIELKNQLTDKRFHDSVNTIKVKRFFLLGLNASKEIRKGVNCFFSIDNLLNLKYQVIRDYPIPGFNITTGVKVEF